MFCCIEITSKISKGSRDNMHQVELPFNQGTPFLTKSVVNRPFLPLLIDDGSMTTSVESFLNI